MEEITVSERGAGKGTVPSVTSPSYPCNPLRMDYPRPSWGRIAQSVEKEGVR